MPGPFFLEGDSYHVVSHTKDASGNIHVKVDNTDVVAITADGKLHFYDGLPTTLGLTLASGRIVIENP